MVHKIKWNNGIGKSRRCKETLWTSRKLFKSILMQLDTIHSECWTDERILVNTWKCTFDGPGICFFQSFKYSLPIFVVATKSYSRGNDNLLFLTGPLQPWQTLTLLLQRLTKVIRELHCKLRHEYNLWNFWEDLFLQKTYSSTIDFFVRNIFQKCMKKCLETPSKYKLPLYHCQKQSPRTSPVTFSELFDSSSMTLEFLHRTTCFLKIVKKHRIAALLNLTRAKSFLSEKRNKKRIFYQTKIFYPFIHL